MKLDVPAQDLRRFVGLARVDNPVAASVLRGGQLEGQRKGLSDRAAAQGLHRLRLPRAEAPPPARGNRG